MALFLHFNAYLCTIFPHFAMLTKSKAIVIHTIKYGDNKMIVDMFTRVNGRVAFVVGIPKSAKAKLQKQLFQPLTLLDLEYDFRSRLQLQKLRDAAIIHPYSSLVIEPDKITVGMFLSEFLCHALYGEQTNEQLFDYVADSLMWLDDSPKSSANFHLVFMMRLTRFLGFYPYTDGYVEGCVFDLRSGSFSITVPSHRDYLDSAESSLISLMMRMNYPTMHLFRMSRQQRNRLLDIIIQYYRLHLPAFPEMKSLDVLRYIYK